MSAEYVNNVGSLIAFVVLAILAIMFVGTVLTVAKQRLVGSKNEEEGAQPESKSEKAAANTVDMTPPVLTQPTASIDPVSKPAEAVVQAEATVVQVSESSFKTEVQPEGSKVARKGTANDPARWACLKTFFGVGYATAPQAVRSSDPQRFATALRLREEAVAEAAVARKAEAKRAKKFQARVKKMTQDATDAAAEAALLEHHLREEGVMA